MIIIWANDNEASGVTNNTTDKRSVALCTPLPEVATPNIPWKWSIITEWSFSDVPGNSVTWRVSRISHHMNIITPEPEGPEVSKQVTIQFGLVNWVTFLQQSSRPPGVRPAVCSLHHIYSHSQWWLSSEGQRIVKLAKTIVILTSDH